MFNFEQETDLKWRSGKERNWDNHIQPHPCIKMCFLQGADDKCVQKKFTSLPRDNILYVVT